MKKTLVLLFCLAFLSLACIWTASPMVGYPTVPPSATVEELPMTATISPQLCAVVVADEALHLRKGPDEHAGILTWLNHGDVVHVVDSNNGDWWRVEFEEWEGYARAVYLEQCTCPAVGGGG
jgi:uncharacterized protein YgiM (DUF1202 family)